MTTYYVCPSTVNTSNIGTYDNPFKCNNINWTSVIAGDSLFLRSDLGDYNETLTIGKSGTAGNYITIESDSNNKAVIDGQNTRLEGITHSAKSYIIIKNIIIKNTTGANNRAISAGNDWKIISNEISNCYFGVTFSSRNNPFVDSCIFTNCYIPISCYVTTGNITLTNITTSATTNQNTIYIYGSNSTGILLIDNIVLDGGNPTNYGALLYIDSCVFSNGSNIDNVLAKNSTQNGIIIKTSSNITLNNITTTINTLVGFKTSFTHDIIVNQSVSTLNSQVGFFCSSSYNITFNDCISDHNLMDGFSCIYQCHSIYHNRCISKNNAIENNTPGSDGDGFTSHDTCYDLYYVFCLAANNANTGFAMIETSAGYIYHCSSYRNGNNVNTTRGGYYINTTGLNSIANKGWVIKNCIGYLDYPVAIKLSSSANTTTIADYNSYLAISDNSFASINNLATTWVSYHSTHETNSRLEDSNVLSNGELLSISPCIDTGITIADVNDAGQLDMFGYAVLGRPNIGCSQQYGKQAKGTLTLSWTPCFSKADVSGELNILSFDSSTNHLRYDATNGALELYDGTNIASVALNCVANTMYQIKATWEGSNMKLWVGTTVGTIGTFAGSFATDDMVIGLNNNELQYVKYPKVLKQPNWDTPS